MEAKNFLSSLIFIIKIAFEKNRNSVFLFFFIILLNSLAAVLEGISFSFILLALTALSGETSTFFILKPNFHRFFGDLSQTHLFVVLFTFAISCQLIRSAVHYIGQVGATKLAASTQSETLNRVYKQIFRFSYRFVSQYKTGDLVEHVTAPLHFISPLIDALNRLLIASLMSIAYLGMMVLIAPGLTLLNITFFAFIGISQRLIIKKIMNISEKYSNSIVDLNKTTVQSLYGIKMIHTFNRQQEIFSQVKENVKAIAAATKRLNLWYHFILPYSEIVGVLLVSVSLIAGIFLLNGEKLPLLPLLLTFLTLTYRMSSRLQASMTAIGTIASYKGQIDRLKEILNEEGKDFGQKEGKDTISFSSEISFKKVSFQYPQREEYALKDLSFNIQKGSVVALVGQSGAGKSTALEILSRLYDPTEGMVHIDGIDIKTCNIASLRKLFGVVHQEAILFNESIADNIRFGNKEISQGRIEEAATQANIHHFIVSLPAGYKTIVGERGYRLSVGEKQRIALARALAKDPEVLILDEATSNLDSESEHLIQEALENFRRKKTILLVAHRLSTIAQADQILVLDKGRLVEAGSHNDLLKLGGRYQLFWHLQTKAEEIGRK